ncbi:MAG: fumarylacetoacetate hydrolase family protein [Proteobacteria bacterium]|nr:fumarylacetoacetate hydrolase family protein [Pseudomonadota bacterium]
MPFAFAPSPPPAAAIAGSATRFPVRRIFCIGRNYAEHAAEMGASVDRGNPVFFCKPADAIVVDGADVPYPQATKELHHEVEMVVALHSGGIDIAEADALTHVFGYAVGLDLTRRDLQAIAKAKGMPWDTAKAFDHSAPLSPIRPAAEIGHPRSAALTLAVNGQLRQQSDIAQMIFNVPEMLARLSRLFELKAGDLVFTGTPAGVGPLVRGDAVHAQLAGLTELRCRIA